MEKIGVVVLAAGKGKRMGSEEGSEIPKVMFRANGKPVVEYLIGTLKKTGLTKIVLVVGYKQEIIRNYFKDKVEYAVQEEQIGTGHAAMQAKDNLEGKTDAVIVCYGDMPLYKAETIKNLIYEYQAEKPTIAMLSVDFDDPNYWSYGRIVRDSDGSVEAIIEQKDCTPEQLNIKESNPGFYIFDSSWLWQNFEKLKTDNAQHEYYLTDMIKIARSQGKKIIAVKVSDQNEVLGINTPEQLKKVEEILAK